MPIVRITTADRRTTKLLSYKDDIRGFLETVRQKFGDVGGDFCLVDGKDGAVIDEDVLEDVITSCPNMLLMIVKDGEKWKADTSTGDDTHSVEHPLQPAPPKKQKHTVESLSAEDDAMFIQDILQRTPGGGAILAHDENHYIVDKSRRLLVNIAAAHMMEKHGSTPPSAVKKKYALGIVNLFSSLKDPHTATGHEAFYDERSNTGFLAARIKNINRTLPPQCKKRVVKSTASNMTGGPLNQRSHTSKESDLQDLQDDVNWLKHTPKMYTEKSDVLERMRKTFPVRRDMVTKPEATAGSIIQEFPRFLNTPELLEQDFALMFPEKHTKFFEKWPNMQEKILVLAKETAGKNKTTTELIATAEGRNIHGGYDASLASILLVLCLLPPSGQGQAGVPKMSVHSAIDLLVQFVKTGTGVEEFLTNGKEKKMQPYLLAIGMSRQQINQYFVIIDHKALPCPGHDAEVAIDSLFKAHYVFGLEYARPLQNFWTFLQTTVYGVDVGTTHESPRVRELRSKLHE